MNFPLLFTFHDPVFGRGFIAAVEAQGRVLATKEEDGWWLYGVNPGALAAGGAGLAEAHLEFRSSYRSVLYDIAAEADSCQTFQEQVEAFFHAANEPTRVQWTTAVADVRSGAIIIDELPGISKTEDADRQPRVVVQEIPQEPHQLQPSQNVLDKPELKAAAWPPIGRCPRSAAPASARSRRCLPRARLGTS